MSTVIMKQDVVNYALKFAIYNLGVKQSVVTRKYTGV
jgi:hypothetical protein